MRLLILLFIFQFINFCNTIDYKSINSQNPLLDKIEKIVISKAKSNSLNGISIAVVESNKNLFLSGYGMGSKKKNLEINDSTLFKVGSISKVFTALLIMKLVETGKLNLDKTIDTYIKEFSINKRYISSTQIFANY